MISSDCNEIVNQIYLKPFHLQSIDYILHLQIIASVQPPHVIYFKYYTVAKLEKFVGKLTADAIVNEL